MNIGNESVFMIVDSKNVNKQLIIYRCPLASNSCLEMVHFFVRDVTLFIAVHHLYLSLPPLYLSKHLS